MKIHQFNADEALAGLQTQDRQKEYGRNEVEVVLLDDNFSNIIAAIEECRAVYANIRPCGYRLHLKGQLSVRDSTTCVGDLVDDTPIRLSDALVRGVA